MDNCMLSRDLNSFIMDDGWQAPYLRREVNGLFEKFFSGNGYYPNDGDYTTDIRLNLQVFCDANHRVSSMSYYKVHDLTSGHGKPVLRHADLSKKDIAVFKKALSECTISSADTELENILMKASGKKLPNGWKVVGFDKRSVSFAGNAKVQIKIPRSHICNAIDISHNYLEMLSVKEFWAANKYDLNLDDADPLLALFSLIDPSGYYEYEIVKRESDERIQQSEIKARISLIEEAANTGNDKEIRKQLNQLPMDKIKGKELTNALCIAIRQKHESAAKILVKYGADININHWNDGHVEGPLFYALDNKWDAFLSFCLKGYYRSNEYANEFLVDHALEKNRPDLALKLIRLGTKHLAFSNVLTEWTPSDLQKALNIPGADIQWYHESLQELLDAGERKLLKSALRHMSYEKEHLRGGIVSWLMDTGDLDLMKHYMKQGYPPLTKDSQFRIYNSINPRAYTKQWAQFYNEQLFGDVYVWKEFISNSAKLAKCQGEEKVIQFLKDIVKVCPFELNLDKEIKGILNKYLL